ncbi:MAG TPA: GNAT family N-acetyltransferase [Candidatus Nitrosocosmicus sp.]
MSDILINEVDITLDFDNLDSDLLDIKNHYSKNDGGCFWIVEHKNDSHIIGTVAIRNLKDLVSISSAELKRMFLAKSYRGLGIGQQMIETAIDFAKRMGYTRILLDSSKKLKVSRNLYLKNGFLDISRYNNNHRADVFMEKKL